MIENYIIYKKVGEIQSDKTQVKAQDRYEMIKAERDRDIPRRKVLGIESTESDKKKFLLSFTENDETKTDSEEITYAT